MSKTKTPFKIAYPLDDIEISDQFAPIRKAMNAHHERRMHAIDDACCAFLIKNHIIINAEEYRPDIVRQKLEQNNCEIELEYNPRDILKFKLKKVVAQGAIQFSSDFVISDVL